MNLLPAKLQKNIDNLPTSIRAIILLVILGTIFTVWYHSFWEDIQDSLIDNSEKINKLKKSVPKLEAQLKTIKQEEKKKKASKSTNKILDPNKMKTFLHDILMANKHLTLIQLEKTPPIAAVVPDSKTKIFEHGIMIKFLGDYFSTMNYLQEIEKLPWRIYWDRLEYRVIDYPTAEITLYLHTTSNENEWIHI